MNGDRRRPGSARALPLRVPGMLLLGSTGQNSGKTLFATRLIERLAGRYRIIGLKVSTVRDPDGSCPRHRHDCDVCGELDSGFAVSEETVPGEKDTGRMVAAGADRVFWLRSCPEAHGEGIREVLRRIGPLRDTLIVCESNSLRFVAEPDIFLMLSPAGVKPDESGAVTPAAPAGDGNARRALKPGAAAVREYVDRQVVFTPAPGAGAPAGEFDFAPDEVLVVDGQFSIRRPGTALLLAGGPSRRMGTDKRQLPIGSTTLVVRAWRMLSAVYSHVLVSSNDTPPGLEDAVVVPDLHPGIGPIGGIEAGIAAATEDPVFVIACDIPGIDQAVLAALYRALPGHDIAVPRCADGRYETLFALYRRRTLPLVRELINRDERRIRVLFSQVKTAEEPMGVPLGNVNTRDEYEQLVRRARS